jgi:DNA polymerase
LDFETASCADLRKVGAWRYAEDPSTFILCLGYKVVTDGKADPTEVLTEKDIAWRSEPLFSLVGNPDVIFVAHNANFEQAIWRHIMVGVHGWPPLPPERWHDTMAVACRKTLPPALDNVGAVLKLPVQKDKEGHRLMMQMCKPGRNGFFDHDPVKMDRLVQYNVGDVDTQYELHRALGGLGPEERRVWILDQKVNQRGIRVDVAYVRQCMGLLEAARAPMERSFCALTGGISPTQRAKTLEWIQEQGVKMFDLRKATLDAFLDPENELDDFDDLPANVLEVIKIRRVLASSSVAKLGRMIETMNFDGRIRGTMQYHGARTGRTAGRLVQPLNMPRPTILSDNLTQGAVMDMIRRGAVGEINEACGNVYEAVISTLRGCFAPAKGHIFAVGDFNAIEARIVLALAGEYDRANSFDKGDPYSDMAASIYGRPVNKRDHPKLRHDGKTVVLGAGYQMSAAKFSLVTGKPEDFSERAITTYRKEWAPLVPKLWYGLDDASTKAVWCNARRAYEYRGISYQMRGQYLVCRLPSGREIYYFEPKREQKQAPWDRSQILPAWSFLSFQGKRIQRKWMFGGLATENVVQAVARDIMVEAMFRCEGNGLPIVFTVYDELIAEPLLSLPDPDKLLKQCMEERSDWVKEYQIPIMAECETMHEYAK